MNTFFHILPNRGATGISQTVAFPLPPKVKENKHLIASMSSSRFVYLLIFDSISLPYTDWSGCRKEPLSVVKVLSN